MKFLVGHIETQRWCYIKWAKPENNAYCMFLQCINTHTHNMDVYVYMYVYVYVFMYLVRSTGIESQIMNIGYEKEEVQSWGGWIEILVWKDTSHRSNETHEEGRTKYGYSGPS